MATLTVTIKEELTLNGADRGGVNTASYTVTDVSSRVATITSTEQSVLLFGATIAAGTLKSNTVNYLRITNLDAAATVTLRIADASQEYFVVIEPLGSYVLTNDNIDADNTGGEEIFASSNITSIKAKSSVATSSLEIFAAS